jgi:amino acid transporter
MKTISMIFGSIFSIIFAVLFNFNHIYLGLICAILAILSFLVALFANLIKNKRTKKHGINLNEFTFVDPPGYYTHPNFKYPICPFCLNKSGLVSPLSQMEKNSWLCNVCRQPTIHSVGEIFSLDDYE